MGDLSFAPQGDGPNFQMLSQLKLLSQPREKLSPSLQVESNCTSCYGPESFSQNPARPHSASDQCPTHGRSLQQFFWNWPRANGRAKAERKLRPTRALSVESVGDPTTLEARHSSAKRPGRLVTAAPSACFWTEIHHSCQPGLASFKLFITAGLPSRFTGSAKPPSKVETRPRTPQP